MIDPDPTEAVPAVYDFYDGPTTKLLKLPRTRPVMSKGTQRETVCSIQEPQESVLAWPPVAIFLAVLVFYVAVLWFGVVHANEVLYVLLIEWRL